MNNELETWAYTQEDLTLDALNAKNAELLQAYEQMRESTSPRPASSITSEKP